MILYEGAVEKSGLDLKGTSKLKYKQWEEIE